MDVVILRRDYTPISYAVLLFKKPCECGTNQGIWLLKQCVLVPQMEAEKLSIVKLDQALTRPIRSGMRRRAHEREAYFLLDLGAL